MSERFSITIIAQTTDAMRRAWIQVMRRAGSPDGESARSKPGSPHPAARRGERRASQRSRTALRHTCLSSPHQSRGGIVAGASRMEGAAASDSRQYIDGGGDAEEGGL